MIDPESVDPATIRVEADTNLAETLRGIGQVVKASSKTTGKHIMVYHDEETDQIAIRSQEPEVFETSAFKCPRAADIEYEQINDKRRGLPSMLAYPTGKLIVSKPALCESCTWYLYRLAHGNCLGKEFKQIEHP